MATGGVLVQVPDDYAEEAKALIASANGSTDETASE